MSTLDPNAQLAMAAGQLQQQYALPGAYNSLSAPSQVESTASMLTQGVTSGLLPAASLVSAIGLSSMAGLSESPRPGLARFAKGRLGGLLTMNPTAWGTVGARMGSMSVQNLAAVRSASKLRYATGLVGGTAGVIGSFAAPLALAEIYANAGQRMVEGQREFLATRQLVRELPLHGEYGPQSLLSGAAGGPASIAGNPMALSQLQTNLSSIGTEFGASTAQMRNLTSGLASNGMINTSSVSAISRSLRQSMRELKEISKLVGSDLEEAVGVYSQIKQMGFGTASSRRGALRQMAAASGISGLSLEEVGRTTNSVIQSGQQLGLSTAAGLDLATSSIAGAAYRHSTGLIDPQYLQRVGGLSGYAERMASAQVGVLASPGADAAMSRLFTASGSRRTSGLDELLDGGRLSSRSSFNREVDPYQLSSMRRRFSEMSDSVILGGVDAIQSRYSGNQTRANRRQYEFLAQFGVTDPDEQIEFLQHLRAQPRAQALLTGQALRNAEITTQADDPMRLKTRIGDALDTFVRKVIGSGEALERYGAALQVRAERAISDANDATFGRARSLPGGMYSEEALNYGRRARITGNMPGVYNDPGTSARRLLDDPVFREALGASPDIGGAYAQRGEAGVYNSLFRATTGINQMLSPVTGDRARLFRRGSFFESFGVGSAAEGSGVFVGPDTSGSGRFATSDEFLTMWARQHGSGYDARTGQFATADPTMVRDIMYYGAEAIAGVEHETVYGTRRGTRTRGRRVNAYGASQVGAYADEGRGFLGLFNRQVNASADQVLGSGGARTYSLTETQLEQVRGANRDAHLDDFARAAFGKPFNDPSLTESERMSLLEALRQMPGQVGQALAGDAAGMSPQQQLAGMANAAAQSMLMQTLGDPEYGGDPGEDTSPRRAPMFARAAAAGMAPMRGLSFRIGAAMNINTPAAALQGERGRSATADPTRTLGLDALYRGEVSGLFDEGRGLTAFGTLRGALTTGSVEEVLGGFVRGGETFGTSAAEQSAGITSFLAAGIGSAQEAASMRESVTAWVAGQRESGALDDAAMERLRLIESLATGSGSMQAPISPEALRAIRAQATPERLAQVNIGAGLQRTAAAMGADAVLEERSSLTLGVIRRQSVEDLVNLLPEGTRYRDENGDPLSRSDVLHRVRSGTLTPEAANAIFDSDTVRAAVEDRQRELSGTPRGDRLQQISGLTTQAGGAVNASGILQGLVQGAFNEEGFVDTSRMANLEGTRYGSALETVRQISERGGRDTDVERVRDLFGADLEAMLEKFAISGTGTGRDRVEALVERLESGADSQTREVLSRFVTTAYGLGEDAEVQAQQQQSQLERDRFYENMNRVVRSGGGNALAVVTATNYTPAPNESEAPR